MPQYSSRGPQNSNRHYYRTRRQRRENRKKAVISALVLAVLVVIMLATAIFVAGGEETAPASSSMSAPVSSAPAAAPSAVAVPSSSSVPQEPPRTPTPYDEEGIPALFNRFNYIPDDWSMNLVDVGGGQMMDARAADAFLDMVAHAAEEGISLTPLSGYRESSTQYSLYHNKLDSWLAQGYSMEEATELTERYHAIPGTSEHEAALAMDIGDAYVPGANIADTFADTDAYAWLQDNMTQYGFILRYEAENEHITHIAWEPWHYRYVGANHAERIVELDVTLEEYVEIVLDEMRDAGERLPSSLPTFE